MQLSVYGSQKFSHQPAYNQKQSEKMSQHEKQRRGTGHEIICPFYVIEGSSMTCLCNKVYFYFIYCFVNNFLSSTILQPKLYINIFNSSSLKLSPSWSYLIEKLHHKGRPSLPRSNKPYSIAWSNNGWINPLCYCQISKDYDKSKQNLKFHGLTR